MSIEVQIELEAENAALRAELDFLHDMFQMHSPHMCGEHSYRFTSGWPWNHARGPSIQIAIQRAMAEVERSKKEMEAMKKP